MDISVFSDDKFDTKHWVNNVLKDSEDKSKKENYVMSVIMKLQLYVQQVNQSLEETSQQVLQSLPKVMHDAKNLQQEALVLKEKMALVKEEILKIEQDTGKSIYEIEKLDNIKNQLLSAKQGLHESDNWIILVNDLEEVMDSKNIETISIKLQGMQNSLKLLRNVSDYEDRKMQLEGLKNRLEAIASPAIVQAFTSNNAEQSLTYVKIFSSIERLPQLLKYYQKCQKDILLQKWRNQVEIGQDEPFTHWIHNYYDVLLSNWHTQFKWFNQVFVGEPVYKNLLEIYTETISSLDPNINECIDAVLKQTPDKLSFLHEVLQITKGFVNNLLNLLKSPEKLKENEYFDFLQAVYAPFSVYIGKYSTYEQSYLNQKLSEMKCIKEELPDTIQALGLNISAIMDAAREARLRCEKITENCGFCGLLFALKNFLLNYADLYRVALRQLDRLKVKKEDWNTFQLCLTLLQNCGDVLINLQALEKDLTSSVIQMSASNIEYKDLLLSPSDKKELESLVKCVTDGTQLSLLDQVTTEFNKLCSDIHETTYTVVFAPVSIHLEILQSPKLWSSINESNVVDLPDYSFSPQEYITQIGQFLMTLPQHLEPFFFRENPSLTCALKAANPEYNNAGDVEGGLANIFLTMVARGICDSYCDHILSICELSHSASRQLAHDIGYLGNILEDFGLSLTENLTHILALLKIPADQYQSRCSGYSARYVAAVRQMRNITSTS